jgi:hypothetical protein
VLIMVTIIIVYLVFLTLFVWYRDNENAMEASWLCLFVHPIMAMTCAFCLQSEARSFVRGSRQQTQNGLLRRVLEEEKEGRKAYKSHPANDPQKGVRHLLL